MHAIVLRRPVRGQEVEVKEDLLFSFELCQGQSTYFFHLPTDSGLLFSFELCESLAIGTLFTRGYRLACYFLLNYARRASRRLG